MISLLSLVLMINSVFASRTCFIDLHFVTGTGFTTVYDFADKVNTGLLSCRTGERLCWVRMQSHIEEHLGTGVGPIRDIAAQALCNIIKREIPNTAPTQVYADWKVSNCDRRGRMYLGQLCCWRYSIGGQLFFTNNPNCTQCTKPNCTEEVQVTRTPFIPIKPITLSRKPVTTEGVDIAFPRPLELEYFLKPGKAKVENSIVGKVNAKASKVDEAKTKDLIPGKVNAKASKIDEVKAKDLMAGKVNAKASKIDEVKAKDPMAGKVNAKHLMADEVNANNAMADEVNAKNAIADEVNAKASKVDDDVETKASKPEGGKVISPSKFRK